MEMPPLGFRWLLFEFIRVHPCNPCFNFWIPAQSILFAPLVPFVLKSERMNPMNSG
jgi:hypothetical protein